MTRGRAKLCGHTLMCHILAHPPGYHHLNNLLPFGDQGALSRVAEIKVNEEKYMCHLGPTPTTATAVCPFRTDCGWKTELKDTWNPALPSMQLPGKVQIL